MNANKFFADRTPVELGDHLPSSKSRVDARPAASLGLGGTWARIKLYRSRLHTTARYIMLPGGR
jgi:hypothetical protein